MCAATLQEGIAKVLLGTIGATAAKVYTTKWNESHPKPPTLTTKVAGPCPRKNITLTMKAVGPCPTAAKRTPSCELPGPPQTPTLTRKAVGRCQKAHHKGRGTLIKIKH